MKAAVKTLENKAAGNIDLDPAVFGIEMREDVLHRVIHYQRNKARAGTHKVKQRHEVRGTGAKPWRQKGTGRARAGDLKRNIDRGGATVFGPVVRDHKTALPRKMRKLAMKMVLSAKARDGKLIILEEAKAKTHRTKPMAAALAKLGLDSALIIGGKEIEVNFARSTANLPRIDVLASKGANVYDIMRRDVLVLTKEAVNDLTDKLKG